ncbi:hypothetical protein COI_0209 [Mannheimia haemolytica serotype A2 str. OVINE]|nr:hypothetical protein COI_0209 [Mannheimia haemolytica serotype A2 str. OVINE]
MSFSFCVAFAFCTDCRADCTASVTGVLNAMLKPDWLNS